MINRDNIHELPTFNNHIEAKEHFKKQYGDRFIDAKITTFHEATKKRKHFCYIKITGNVVRPLRIAEDGTIELVD